MKVTKRSGQVQEFDNSKIKTSIGRASDDAKEPFTMSDVENINSSIMKKIKNMNKESIDSECIFEIVIVELMKAKFYSIAKAYCEGANI